MSHQVFIHHFKMFRSGDYGHSINFEAFGMKKQVDLIRNDKLLSKQATMVLTFGDEKSPLIPDQDQGKSCHFLHSSDSMSAAFSNCENNKIYTGHLIHEGQIFEVNPLQERFHETLDALNNQETEMDFAWHIITRRPVDDLPQFDEDLPLNVTKNVPLKQVEFGLKKKRGGSSDLTIETAVFLDPTAYQNYLRYYRGDSNKVVTMLLAFMNGIQAIYHFKSLGRRIDFTIVHLELMSSSPFNDHRGEREGLLTDFCKYQVKL